MTVPTRIRRLWARHSKRALHGAESCVQGPEGEDGSSLVEFAVTLPVLLLLVTGILVFGVAFSNYIMLNEATAIGARQLAISRGQTLDPCKTVVNAVNAAAPLLIPANLTVTITLNGQSYAGMTSCSGTNTSGAPANMILGTNAVVKVTYPCSLSLFGDLISSGFLLTAQTTEQMQ